MDIFEQDNYKKYVVLRIQSMPKKGYGQLKKLSEYLDVSSTLVSHIFHGDRSLNLEQAILVCDFFGLSEMESDYFLLLVHLERAGTTRLKNVLKKQLEKIREQSQKVGHRVPTARILSEEDKAIFYSDWYHSAIRLLTSITEFSDIDKISDHVGLPRKEVAHIIQFLLKTGLCLEKNGRLELGPSRTYIDAESPFIKLHHSNWRFKGMEHMKNSYPEKLHYTSPMTVSKKRYGSYKGQNSEVYRRHT